MSVRDDLLPRHHLISYPRCRDLFVRIDLGQGYTDIESVDQLDSTSLSHKQCSNACQFAAGLYE